MYNFYPKKLVQPRGCTINILLIMKLTTLILITAILQVSANAFAQKVTLSERNAPLNKIFEKISEQTGFDFLVSTENLKMAKSVTINVQNEDLKSALDKVFTGRPLSFVIQEKMVVVSKKEPRPEKPKGILMVPVIVTGRVTDTTGLPLPGATVRIKGSDKITLTDKDGTFTINAQADDEIAVSFVGYNTYSFKITGNLPFQNITLHPASSKLQEVSVVSTGYQTIPKERVTGSFAQINNELLNRRVGANVIDRLEGVVPGLIFNHNTYASSNGVDISIRGHSTLFANDQPLIVLDNFPYDGNIGNINPNDIESVTILKDAAAASIWGVKSGNGVIVITTKHGEKNSKMVVDVNSNLTIGEKPKLYYSPNFLGSNDFINVEEALFKQGYYTNDLSSSSYPPISPVVAILASNLSQNEKTSKIDSLRNYDVRQQLEKYLYRPSFNQQYSVNLKGGGNNNDYFISAGYDNDLNNQKGNGNQRVTLNSIYNFSPNKKLDFSIGLNFTQSFAQSNSPVGNINAGSKSIYPYAQFADANGNALSIVKDYAGSYTDAALQNGFQDWKYRPLDELNNSDNTSKLTDNKVNFGIKYKAFPGFSADLKYQYEKSTSETAGYSSLASYYTRNLINEFTQNNSGVLSYPVPVGGILDQQNQDLTSQRLRLQSNYTGKWGVHGISAIAGAEISDVTTAANANTIYGYDKSTGAFTPVDFTTYFQNNPSGSSSKIPSILGFQNLSDRYISYFGNAGYTYSNRYGFSLSGRIDKSNLFGVNTNQKSVPLYSTGVSWALSNENFYHVDWLPYAKLRLTYGYSGNVDKNVTAVTTIQQLSNSYLSGTPYATIANPGNPELRWEKVSMTNLGFDYATKNNVLSGSIEYYIKKGIDLIGDSPLPASSGFTTFRGNTANTSGQGLDVVINSVNFEKGNFKWTTNVLFSYATDKVTRYSAPVAASDALIYGTGNNGVILPLVDRPLFGVYSYKWAGLDPANGNPRGFLNGKPSSDYAAIIANTPLDSLKFNGTSRPKIFGSFRNTFSYKNFSLSANIIYKLAYFFRRTSISYSSLYQLWQGNRDYTKRWQKPGDELITDVPSEPALPVDGSRDSFYASSAALISPGDLIRLQDINLSYDFNKTVLKGTPFHRFQIYCYINNIGLIWKANKQGLDPDLFSSALPIPRTISFGIKTQL